MGFFAKLNELSGGTFRLDVRDVVAGEEHLVVLITGHAQRSGRTLNDRAAQVWGIRAGKSARFVHLSEDPYAADEFWS